MTANIWKRKLQNWQVSWTKQSRWCKTSKCSVSSSKTRKKKPRKIREICCASSINWKKRWIKFKRSPRKRQEWLIMHTDRSNNLEFRKSSSEMSSTSKKAIIRNKLRSSPNPSRSSTNNLTYLLVNHRPSAKNWKKSSWEVRTTTKRWAASTKTLAKWTVKCRSINKSMVNISNW